MLCVFAHPRLPNSIASARAGCLCVWPRTWRRHRLNCHRCPEGSDSLTRHTVVNGIAIIGRLETGIAAIGSLTHIVAGSLILRAQTLPFVLFALWQQVHSYSSAGVCLPHVILHGPNSDVSSRLTQKLSKLVLLRLQPASCLVQPRQAGSGRIRVPDAAHAQAPEVQQYRHQHARRQRVNRGLGRGPLLPRPLLHAEEHGEADEEVDGVEQGSHRVHGLLVLRCKR